MKWIKGKVKNHQSRRGLNGVRLYVSFYGMDFEVESH